MKKRNTLVLPGFLAIVIILLAVQCPFEPGSRRGGGNASRSAREGSGFADDRVLVALGKETSKDFRTYTPEDFPEIPCTRVDDLTVLTMGLVQKQLEAEKTGDWSELKEHVEHGMLVT